MIFDFFKQLFKPRPKIHLGKAKEVDVEPLPLVKQWDVRKVLPVKRTSMVDREYYLLSRDQISNFLAKDGISKNSYIKEKFDCDDFAIALLGRMKERFPGTAVGYAQSSEHAFNIFVDQKGVLWVIEPQTDFIFKYGSRFPKYEIKRVLI